METSTPYDRNHSIPSKALFITIATQFVAAQLIANDEDRMFDKSDYSDYDSDEAIVNRAMTLTQQLLDKTDDIFTQPTKSNRSSNR
jgi:hypothetical protein